MGIHIFPVVDYLSFPPPPLLRDTRVFIDGKAVFSHSSITVPLYDTLGHDTLEFVINQTEVTTVVCSGTKELHTLVALVERGVCPSLQVRAEGFTLRTGFHLYVEFSM